MKSFFPNMSQWLKFCLAWQFPRCRVCRYLSIFYFFLITFTHIFFAFSFILVFAIFKKKNLALLLRGQLTKHLFASKIKSKKQHWHISYSPFYNFWIGIIIFFLGSSGLKLVHFFFILPATFMVSRSHFSQVTGFLFF